MTVTLDGQTLNVTSMDEATDAVATQSHAWENEEYVRKVNVRGEVQGWSLQCYEKGVTWANSVVKRFKEKLKAGDPVAFVVTEAGDTIIDTTVYVGDVSRPYESADGVYRFFKLLLQRAAKLDECDYGCVLWLPMDEGEGDTAYDASGKANHGTLYGPSWVDGKFGKALDFDGASDDMAVSMSKPALPFFLELWIKPDVDNPVGMFDTGPGVQYPLRNYPGGYVEWWGNNPQVPLGLAAGNEYHLVFVFRQTTVNVIDYYRNGDLVGTYPGHGLSDFAWTDPIRFGSINSGSAGRLDAILDEIRIVAGREPSAAEVKRNYNRGRVCLDGLPLQVERMEEVSDDVSSEWDAWEDESYVKKVHVLGEVQKWRLEAFETGISWSESVVKHLTSDLSKGEAVTFKVSENGGLIIDTYVYVLGVSRHYESGRADSRRYRRFTVTLQEA